MTFENLTREDVVKIIRETIDLRPCTGTVHDISSGKVQLIVAGEAAPTEKYYKCAAGYSPKVGDRVYFVRISDSYLVIDKF